MSARHHLCPRDKYECTVVYQCYISPLNSLDHMPSVVDQASKLSRGSIAVECRKHPETSSWLFPDSAATHEDEAALTSDLLQQSSCNSHTYTLLLLTILCYTDHLIYAYAHTVSFTVLQLIASCSQKSSSPSHAKCQLAPLVRHFSYDKLVIVDGSNELVVGRRRYHTSRPSYYHLRRSRRANSNETVPIKL